MSDVTQNDVQFDYRVSLVNNFRLHLSQMFAKMFKYPQFDSFYILQVFIRQQKSAKCKFFIQLFV